MFSAETRVKTQDGLLLFLFLRCITLFCGFEREAKPNRIFHLRATAVARESTADDSPSLSLDHSSRSYISSVMTDRSLIKDSFIGTLVDCNCEYTRHRRHRRRARSSKASPRALERRSWEGRAPMMGAHREVDGAELLRGNQGASTKRCSDAQVESQQEAKRPNAMPSWTAAAGGALRSSWACVRATQDEACDDTIFIRGDAAAAPQRERLEPHECEPLDGGD